MIFLDANVLIYAVNGCPAESENQTLVGILAERIGNCWFFLKCSSCIPAPFNEAGIVPQPSDGQRCF
jgi:hypothetical protein